MTADEIAKRRLGFLEKVQVHALTLGMNVEDAAFVFLTLAGRTVGQAVEAAGSQPEAMATALAHSYALLENAARTGMAQPG